MSKRWAYRTFCGYWRREYVRASERDRHSAQATLHEIGGTVLLFLIHIPVENEITKKLRLYCSNSTQRHYRQGGGKCC